jgi:hypothetical protein
MTGAAAAIDASSRALRLIGCPPEADATDAPPPLMPFILPAAAERAALVRYRVGTRIFLVTTGVVFVATFGLLGVFVLRGVGAAGTTVGALEVALLAALMLAPAIYGLVLAWRGLRGHWRPQYWTRWLASLVVIALVAATLAVIPSTALRMVSTDHVAMLRGGLRSVGGVDWYFTLMMLAAPFQLVAHELGHVLAGRSVGFEFLSIQVGPFCLERPTTSWRATWKPLAFGFGGRATMRCRSRHDLPRRKAIFAAGGPVANLLVATLAGLAAALLGTPSTSSFAWLTGFLWAGAIEGVVLAAFNAIPIRVAGNDGWQVLEAIRSSKGHSLAKRGSRDDILVPRRPSAMLRLIESPQDGAAPSSKAEGDGPGRS